jgi:hypothetical protein
MRAQATHANRQRTMSASRADLQDLEMFGTMASPSCLSSECPLSVFVVGEDTVADGIHVYESTYLLLLTLAPAHMPTFPGLLFLRNQTISQLTCILR